MEEYPEELRTPPVTLISVVGCPELHSLISSHLHSEQPPINTLALPDFSKIYLFSKKRKDTESNPASASVLIGGILKRDWLLKHRTKIPAVLAAFFPSEHVFGEPALWLQVCSDLDIIKTVTRARNMKLIIVVVNSNPQDEISEERIIALRKRAELDSKYVMVFNDASELKQSISRLGSAFAELANTSYRDEGRRIKLRVEKKSGISVELNVRYCFKVAVYAEFQRDWAEALRFYQEAYHTLREIVGTSTRLPAVQRLVEIKTIAEQLHFKISTLLLHGGKVIEAVKWFRQHIATYGKVVGAPQAIFLHWEWMSRQFLVFGELIETSSKNIQGLSSLVFGTASNPLSECECQPAYYYQLAAHYLKEKRSALEIAVLMLDTADEIDHNSESVVPSLYVGQFARLLEQGDGFSMLPLTDEEYTRYAFSEGRRFHDSLEIIALLKRAYELYHSLKFQRMASVCGFLMGKEYYAEGDVDKAREFFDGLATLYRQEGWVALLWEVLGYLRENSRKKGDLKDFVEFSLEMAALPLSSNVGVQKDCGPAGPATLEQRETIQKEVFGRVGEVLGLMPSQDSSHLKVTENNPLHLEIDIVSPLRSVLLASVAFREQTIKPGASTLVMVSLLSHLPLSFEISQLEVQFNQSNCNFCILNSKIPNSEETSNVQRVEKATSLTLASNKWLRLTYEIKSEKSGKLECLSVIAKIGAHFRICCRAESPASINDLPLWKSEDCVTTLPIKDPILAFSGQKASQVEEPDPQIDLKFDASGPALLGETFMVPVTVVSKGHAVYAGELKINLVDVKGGGLFSPREAEPSSPQNLHVELLGISGSDEEDEHLADSEKIKKIQHSFGLISVPFLKAGDSWSCTLEIKWHRPKPIMLFVSLSYSLHSDSAAQKIHVHKSLPIEGKNAITISHKHMLPFRRDPLMLSTIKQGRDSDELSSLPSNETSILIISARNCCEVPLQLQSLTIEADDDDAGKPCSIQHGAEDFKSPAFVVPGEEFKKVYCLKSEESISKLSLGTVCLEWRRSLSKEKESCAMSKASWIMTKHKLPDVNVELPPLLVILECPPYAILGDPFTYYIRIQNQTQWLQEVKLSLADAQSFVLSGTHSDTMFVLPKSEHILSYKLVALASGLQKLPKFTLTSVRYSVAFHPSATASSVFVFPSKPHFETVASSAKRVDSVLTE